MVAVAQGAPERRSEARQPGGARWLSDAVLRPGQPVRVINISSRAALVESGTRLRPGAQTELQLATGPGRTSVRGRLERCFVAALSPLRYRGVVRFEQRLDLNESGLRVLE